MILTVTSQRELDQHFAAVASATSLAVSAIAKAPTPEEVLRRMKFEKVGFHPIDGRPLNLIEQINQTFTYLVALRATAWLLRRHPDAGGFKLAPGAAALMPTDIMSIIPGLVGAETFAAVHPDNNRKLARDVAKLAGMAYKFKYAFFYAPGFPLGRIEKLEADTGVEVHCIEI